MRRLKNFLPIVLIALMVQIFAPIGACWAASIAASDPLAGAAICRPACRSTCRRPRPRYRSIAIPRAWRGPNSRPTDSLPAPARTRRRAPHPRFPDDSEHPK